MTKFIPREKLSKKARKALDIQRRTLWVVPPVAKRVESKKVYNRKKGAHTWKQESGRAPFCIRCSA